LDSSPQNIVSQLFYLIATLLWGLTLRSYIPP
jgi:hypothetical protein